MTCKAQLPLHEGRSDLRDSKGCCTSYYIANIVTLGHVVEYKVDSWMFIALLRLHLSVHHSSSHVCRNRPPVLLL